MLGLGLGLVTLGLRFLGLRQPRVRAKFKLRVLNTRHVYLACMQKPSF